MPGEWTRYTIDQLKADTNASIAIGPFGSRMKSDTYVSSGVPVIRGNNISDTKEFVDDFVYITPEFADQLKSQNVFEGDLVFPHRGNIGKVGIVGNAEPRYVLSTSLMKLTCNRSLVDPLFVFYFFRSAVGHHELMQHASTVGTPGIGTPLTSLRSISVNLPSLPEQQAIACILGALDDKIELNRRMNRTLEGLARAIFQSWFVDFDPVRAKAAGQSPPGLAPLFPDAFENSELGEIPKGWRVGTVDEVADINGRTLGRDDSLEIIDYIEISEVMRGEVATITQYTRGDEPSRARRRLQHGDTALSTVRPDRGAYFLCLNPLDSLIASTGFAVLSSRTAHWAFLHAMVTRQEIGEELGRLADGGAYPAVRPEVIGKLPVVLPGDTKAIGAYDALAQPLLQRSEVNRGEARALAVLRDALLPKLISGELRVADAERIVGRCCCRH